MLSPNMNMRPYIGDESGSQLVPEPSRLMGSARSMVECISISPRCVASDGCDICDECVSGCTMFDVRCSMFDVERWTLDVWRSRGFSGTSFIPHFGQFPG